jgi:hypothetical protein
MLKGRLGNQMFQYAAGRALAERHGGVELVLDTSWMVEFRRGGGVVENELAWAFDLGEQVRPVWEVARVPNPRRWVYALQRLRPSGHRPFVRVVEEDFTTNAFVPEVVTAPDDTYLRGYWQFEGYFADQPDAIRSAFAFREPGEETQRLLAEIGAAEAPVSLHVRRTDYTIHPHLGFLDEAYYARGVAHIAEHAEGIRLFVVSDDPAWCAENLRLPFPTTVVDRPLPPERSWEDMLLVSRCAHHVIANSTFSWWGAWLDPSPSKIVVAPTRWTLGGRREGDPIPADWVRV